MPSPAKLDLYKKFSGEYITPKEPAIVSVKPAKYLAVLGKGAPAGSDFQNAIGALYGSAYTIKMTKKFAGRDYKVCHLEGLWWGREDGIMPSADAPEEWNWKLLIRVPEFIKDADLKAAVKQLKSRGKGDHADGVTLEKIDEGKCVQVLHVGPYGEEPKTVQRMMEFAAAKGLSFHGRHHEIYLSDPRRVPAERLRTILRHPVK